MARNKNKMPTAKNKPSGVTIIKNVNVVDNGKSKSNVGKVYYGTTSYIDDDTRPRRRFVVVNDNGVNVKVFKLKTIKKIDGNDNNADEHLHELDRKKYPKLKERTGVDCEVFTKNRRTKQKLTLGKGNGVFDYKPDFELDSKDTSRVKQHVKLRGGKKKGKKKGK